jgi:Dynamin family
MAFAGGTTQVEDHALETLERIAHERAQEGLAAEAREARAALASGRFNVAIVGQFKRGKSTLINALVGRDLLPADVAPVTTAITIVEYGPAERATVGFDDGREDEIGLGEIPGFVCEDENPGNRKGVRVVRIELPVALLASGMRLVDTPGVGSVFAGNAEVTHAFLHRIDVAVVVLGSDPPISGEELALVRSIVPHVGGLCFVLNKADLASETTRAKAEAFTRHVLRDAVPNAPLFLLHASALAALRSGSEPGVAELEHHLRDLAVRSGGELAGGSAARAARHLAGHLVQQIDLERAALTAPVDDLDRRIAAFLDAVRDVEDLAIAARSRIAAARAYDWSGWAEKKAAFAEDAGREIRRVVLAELEKTPRAGRRRLRESARTLARSLTRERLESWHTLAAAELRRVRESWLESAAGEANRLIDRIAEAAAQAFDISVGRFEPEVLEVDVRSPAFEFFEGVLFLDPRLVLVPVVDMLSSKAAVSRRAIVRAARLAGEWLQRNLYAVDEAMARWIDALATQLDHAIEARLRAARQDVIGAVEVGRRRRGEGQAAVERRLGELARQRDEILGAAAGPR